MIRVVLADDHGIIRDGLGRLISALDDVELVGVAADGVEAVEQCRRTTPDVVLMDLDMPVLDASRRRAASSRRLEFSEKTVKSHLTQVFRALGVTDRTQAALWAERHGLADEWASPTKVPLRYRPAARHDRRTMRTRFAFTTVAAFCVALTLVAPAPALGRGGDDDDVRVSGSCGKGATSKLRLRAKDGAIAVEFEVKGNRGGQRWRVVLVHERRVAWRGRVRTRSGNGSFRVKRSLPDFGGADQVTARASGPGGSTCQATGVLTGS